MRVDLAADVFDGVERLPDLLAMLRCFAVGRHDWVVTDPAVITAAQRYLGRHVPTSSESYVELARKGTVAAAWRAGGSVGAVVQVAGAELVDLVADLQQPAVLVVENATSDGCFIRGLASVFQAVEVQRALVKDWLLVEHGGGETLVDVARAKIRLFRRQVRVAAILDSDRMLPGERTRAHDKADGLQEQGAAVWVLTLREAENYVPNRALDSIGRRAEASRKLSLLKRLTPEQRGHFDMKAGFGVPDHPPVVHRRQRALFDGLDPEILVGLRGGFGNGVLSAFKDSSARLTERDFAALGPAVVTEVRELLTMLASVI